MAKFEEAARQMQNGVGVVRNFRVNAHSMVMEDSKYHSEFERFPSVSQDNAGLI